jgi:hypothetical protein
MCHHEGQSGDLTIDTLRLDATRQHFKVQRSSQGDMYLSLKAGPLLSSMGFDLTCRLYLDLHA